MRRYERRSGKERVFLVGVCEKGQVDVYGYGIEESLEELGRLSRAAGLEGRFGLAGDKGLCLVRRSCGSKAVLR